MIRTRTECALAREGDRNEMSMNMGTDTDQTEESGSLFKNLFFDDEGLNKKTALSLCVAGCVLSGCSIIGGIFGVCLSWSESAMFFPALFRCLSYGAVAGGVFGVLAGSITFLTEWKDDQ